MNEQCDGCGTMVDGNELKKVYYCGECLDFYDKAAENIAALRARVAELEAGIETAFNFGVDWERWKSDSTQEQALARLLEKLKVTA